MDAHSAIKVHGTDFSELDFLSHRIIFLKDQQTTTRLAKLRVTKHLEYANHPGKSVAPSERAFRHYLGLSASPQAELSSLTRHLNFNLHRIE